MRSWLFAVVPSLFALACTEPGAPAGPDVPGGAGRALPSVSGAFRGAYEVPVPAELTAAATFDLDHLDWTVVGDVVTLHYALPVGLVGGNIRVDLSGPLAPGATTIALTGPLGTGTCTTDGLVVTCTEQFHDLGPLPQDAGLVERTAVREYAGPPADRIAVANLFGSPDPIGIATLDLSAPVAED